MATLYIDLFDGRVSTALDEYLAPQLYGVQGSPIKLTFAFHDAGVIRELALIEPGKMILQLKTAVGGTTPRAIGLSWVATGTGTAARYTVSCVADNAQIREDFAAATESLNYEVQINWQEVGDAATRRSLGIPITLDVARDLPNGTTPSPIDELEDPDVYVANRAVCYDRAQSLSPTQQAQALDNLGLNNTLSYQPGIIVVSTTQVPGYHTATTLQRALDEMAASPTTYHTIRLGVDGENATAAAFSIATLVIEGGIFGLGDLDLSAITCDNYIFGCSMNSLKLSAENETPRGFLLRASTRVSINTLDCKSTQRNVGGSSPDSDFALTLYGEFAINADLSGYDGIVDATASHRNGCHGRIIQTEGPCYVFADAHGGIGHDGDATINNGGNGGYPGDYTIGPLGCVEYAPSGDIGGTGGAAYGGGSAGYDASSDTSTGTVHGSATLL